VRGLFNWAVKRGYIDRSPCDKLDAPTKAVSRNRVLSDEELVAVWKGADVIGYPFGLIVQLLLLSGQRRDEVAGLRWSELDLDKGLWSMPAERTKPARPHQIPLSTKATAVLRGVPVVHEALLFPARRSEENSFSGFSKAKAKLDGLSGVSDWRLHDLRRTVSTGMAQLKVRLEVVEKLLNHSSGTLQGVAGVYNRFAYMDEMRDALEQWAERIDSLIDHGLPLAHSSPPELHG